MNRKMGMSENTKGLIVGIASGAFTGPCFILKKGVVSELVPSLHVQDWPGQNVSCIVFEICGFITVAQEQIILHGQGNRKNQYARDFAGIILNIDFSFKVRVEHFQQQTGWEFLSHGST